MRPAGSDDIRFWYDSPAQLHAESGTVFGAKYRSPLSSTARNMRMTIDLVPEAIKPYVGLRFRVQDPWQRAEQMRFSFANECLCGSQTPMGLMARNGVLLNEHTYDYLYNGDFGKIESPYVRGTHPLLERYIDSLTTPAMSDAQRVIAVSQSMLHDLPRHYPPPPAFLYGESDQETLLKGAGHCSCKARLLCACCQIMGIAARPVMQWTWRDRTTSASAAKVYGGHTVTEVLLQGRWGFFDPEYHLYCADGREQFYSVDEVRRSPYLFCNMPAELVGQMNPRSFGTEQGRTPLLEYYWGRYLDPRGPTQISRHDVMEPYAGGWFWATDEVYAAMQRDMDVNEAVLAQLAEQGLITDDIYQLNIEEFRKRFAISDGALRSRATSDFAGRLQSPAP